MAELQAQYNAFKGQLQQLAQKISELETESDEHKLVIDTLKPLSPDRRCLRMVGTVLVDRTVEDVIPALETTKEGLDKAVTILREDLVKTQNDLEAWKKEHNVKVVSG